MHIMQSDATAEAAPPCGARKCQRTTRLKTPKHPSSLWCSTRLVSYASVVLDIRAPILPLLSVANAAGLLSAPTDEHFQAKRAVLCKFLAAELALKQRSALKQLHEELAFWL